MVLRKYITILLLVHGVFTARAQQVTLDNAISIAQENSYDAQLARFSFLAAYWTYRSFKAQLLPSMSLSGTVGSFDHSLVTARNFEDGRVAYVDNNSLANSLTLSVEQQIAATGGTVSLQSYLYRLDQFTYKETTYNSQPLRVNYTQPFLQFNSLKWEKKTAPIAFQVAQKTYLTSMQAITISVSTLFFDVLSAQSDYKQSLSTQQDRETLFKMAQDRLKLGTTTKSEVLQLELSLLNARVAVNTNKLELDDKMYQLFSYLRISDYEGATLVPPYNIPGVEVNISEVLQKAISNSSHTLEQRQQMLEAEKSLAEAKAGRGFQMTLTGEVGFTQSANSFSAAYQRMQDNEIIGLTLTLPIFDWGVSRGKVKMAQAQLDVTRTQQEQAHLDYVQELRKKVLQFNAQPDQCRDAQRAQEIAEERYEITRKRFETGSVTVTDLNTAQQELETARAQYITQLKTFWEDYYSLQKSTLYDWINHRDIEVNFDSLIK
jgi:outer membrane protein TolC